MTKVVLDANVFVIALLTPGSNASTILDLVKTRKLELLVSKSIMAQIAVVLQYPKIKKRHHLVSEAVDEFIDDCTQFATVTQERIRVEVVKNAPADDKYLACAAEGKADFIISGDHHLTDIETFRGIRIVDPAEFLRIVKEGDK
jgi:hypothetical protein